MGYNVKMCCVVVFVIWNDIFFNYLIFEYLLEELSFKNVGFEWFKLKKMGWIKGLLKMCIYRFRLKC